MDTPDSTAVRAAPAAATTRRTCKGAEIMIEYLIKEKVPYLFGVCGHGNIGYCSIRDMQLGLFGQELATSFQIDKTKELYSPDFVMLARSFGVDAARVDRAVDLEGALEVAIKANKPYLVEVPVDREIRPVGTGTWALPPIPHGEPNFRKLAGLER